MPQPYLTNLKDLAPVSECLLEAHQEAVIDEVGDTYTLTGYNEQGEAVFKDHEEIEIPRTEEITVFQIKPSGNTYEPPVVTLENMRDRMKAFTVNTWALTEEGVQIESTDTATDAIKSVDEDLDKFNKLLDCLTK